MAAEDKIELLEFGKNLRKIRKEKGLTLLDLAVRSDLDDKQIAKIEKGKRDIRLSTAIKLIWALEIEPNDIMPYQPKE